jgi:nucleotide-binding universal stress UspA family protein
MFQKILVALDNSEIGQLIFEEALSLAKTNHSCLMLLHILSDTEVGSPTFDNLDEHLKAWERYRQQGLALLQSRQAIALDAGVRAEITQIPGAAPSEICALAKSWQADLIVVGHRKLSRLQQLFGGSVSSYVMHYAPCSVWTVPEPIAVSAAN